MNLIIGLGNPDPKYLNTRHNTGHMFVESVDSRKLLTKNIFKKSSNYMNNSGDFVVSEMLKHNLGANSLYIVHDDLDIKLGEFKIQFGRGPKANNGINDIENKIKTNDFWRIRIGIDNRDAKNRTKGEDYVLTDFDVNERQILNNVFSQICKKLENL